jgi:predicted RNA-binding protein YlxR (DUF448 family)
MPKHIPLRTCVACRQSKPKRGLVRVVHAPTGEAAVDPTGKKAGRGAYLCAARSCWDLALKKRLLEHAFHCSIDEGSRLALEEYAHGLPALPVAPTVAPPHPEP